MVVISELGEQGCIGNIYQGVCCIEQAVKKRNIDEKLHLAGEFHRCENQAHAEE